MNKDVDVDVDVVGYIFNTNVGVIDIIEQVIFIYYNDVHGSVVNNIFFNCNLISN